MSVSLVDGGKKKKEKGKIELSRFVLVTAFALARDLFTGGKKEGHTHI